MPAAVRGFSANEMVTCEKCSRANPPTRLGCLYCGEKLPATKTSAALRRPMLRPLESWEQGFNVVLLAGEKRVTAGEHVEELASYLRMDAATLLEFLKQTDAIPVARAATSEEAELVRGKFSACGIDAEVISDSQFSSDSEPPLRIRGIEFSETHLKGWAAGVEAEPLGWDEILLIVAGRIVTRRVEVEERKGRVKSSEEVADTREIFTDEAALEIHTREGGAGWRVMAGNFDYSCLGAEMALLARDNFLKLTDELRARARGAEFDEGYDRLRPLLGVVWPPTERTKAGGLRRERPGKFNTEAVTIVSNDAQFTRYARLRRLLLARRTQTETG